MEQTAKQPWQKPELTVLVRSNPEETVLTGCKTNVEQSADPSNNDSGCRTYEVGCTYCYGITSS